MKNFLNNLTKSKLTIFFGFCLVIVGFIIVLYLKLSTYGYDLLFVRLSLSALRFLVFSKLRFIIAAALAWIIGVWLMIIGSHL